jgi:hypothetical protein
MDKSTLWTSALFVAATVSCVSANNNDHVENELDELRFGLSRDELTKSFGEAGQHQFVATLEGTEFQCVSYSFVRSYYSYYFVFRDDALTTICRAWDFQYYEIVNKVETEVPWSVERKISEVVNASGLSVEQLVAELNSFQSKEREQRSEFNILPAFVLLSPLIVPIEFPASMARHVRYKDWENRFDAQTIELGMTRQDIDHVLGTPMYREVRDNEETLAYGPVKLIAESDNGLYISAEDRKFWIAVVLEDSMVTRILSDDFFNALDLIQPENAVK